IRRSRGSSRAPNSCRSLKLLRRPSEWTCPADWAILTAMADPISRSLFERAEKVIVGGVNSPVRAFRAGGGGPVVISRTGGASGFGADGRASVDYVGSWGPAILGHAHPDVVKAVQRVAEQGLSFGAPTELEVRFAEKVRELYPSIAKLRCVSSGTEA